MTRRLARTRFIPTGSVKVSDKVSDKASDAIVYLFTSKGRPAVIGYHGSIKMKSDIYVAFATVAQRDAAVLRFFEVRRARAAATLARRADRTKPHKLEVGHVLVCSWGYDQTNVDFYQVTRIVGKVSVAIRPIAARTRENSELAMQGKTFPVIDAFTGDEMIKRVTDGDCVKIASYAHARLWDGKPQWNSWYA